MKRRIFSALFLLLCAMPALAQNLPVCNVTGTIFDSNGQPFAGAVITVRKVTREGALIRNVPQRYQTNSQGQFTIPLPRTTTISGVVKRSRAWIEAPMDRFFVPGGLEVEIPNSDTAELITLTSPALLPNQVAVAVPLPMLVKDEGTTVINTNTFNFVGPGVAVTNSPNGTALITITGGGGGASALDDLNDVAITSPAQGQYLRRGASGWVNSVIQAGDLPAHNHAAGDINSGIFAPGRLGSGTPDNTKILLGDSSWSLITDALVPNTITIDNLTQITTRNYSSLQGIPSSFTPSAHASSHQHGGADEIAVATSTANAIPKANSGGKLDNGWLSSNVTLLGLVVDLNTAEVSGILGSDHFPALTGDVTNSAGSLNISLVNLLTAGSCTNCNLTWDAKGRITAAANGSGGGAGDAITVNGSGATDANFINGSRISFSLNTTPSPDEITIDVVNDSIGPTQINETSNYSWSGNHSHTGVLTTAGRKITRTASSSSSFNVPVGSHYNAFTASNTAQTATLPDGATAGTGAVYIFKDDSGTALVGNKTITRAGSDTIEGGTSWILDTNGRSVTLVWNSTEWKVIK